MTATITDNFKFQVLDQVFQDFKSAGRAEGDSDYFYIGIGRSEEWPNDSDVPVSNNPSMFEERKFRQSLQSVKLVNDVSYIVERYNWSSGSIFSAFDDQNWSTRGIDTVAGRYPFYVLTDENNVYVCLKQGRNTLGIAVPSSVRPEDTTGVPFETSDGYVWKYLYNIGSFEASRYLSSNFMPVAQADSDDASTPAELDQVEVQKLAVAGQVVNVVIDSAGSGEYITAPTLTIVGDGVSAQASCIVSGGRIVDVFMKADPDSDFNVSHFGSGYTFANVEVSSGTASLRAVIGGERDRGIGADPRKDLQTAGLMFNVKTSGDEGGDFLVNQSFRQVGLIKNPQKDSAQFDTFSGDSDFVTPTGSTLRSIIFTPSATFASPEGETITGQTSNAVAYVDDWDADTFTLKFHQTTETGFRDFQEEEVVVASNGAGSGTLLSAATDADDRYYEITEVDIFSGDLFYIDNRSAIVRDADQTEDIKVVIQI